jgi:hypothetical protein
MLVFHEKIFKYNFNIFCKELYNNFYWLQSLIVCSTNNNKIYNLTKKQQNKNIT